MLIFKGIGLIIAFCVPSVYGFLKAYGVSKRNAKLKRFFLSISEISECIRIENTPKNALFSKHFGKELLNENYTLNTEFLKNEDITLLNEFFIGFGLKDKNSEYERTKLYLDRIKTVCENAREEKEQLCKLYSSLGVLSGLGLCIFLI